MDLPVDTDAPSLMLLCATGQTSPSVCSPSTAPVGGRGEGQHRQWAEGSDMI